MKVVNCNVHCQKSGEALAAPAAPLLMALLIIQIILHHIYIANFMLSDSTIVQVAIATNIIINFVS